MHCMLAVLSQQTLAKKLCNCQELTDCISTTALRLIEGTDNCDNKRQGFLQIICIPDRCLNAGAGGYPFCKFGG